MPRAHMGERVTFVIRLPVALATELRATAEREDIPVNAAVQRAVTAWVGEPIVAPAPKKPKAPKPAPDPSVPAQPPASPSREVPTFFKRGAK